jgi:hypothetical protein
LQLGLCPLLIAACRRPAPQLRELEAKEELERSLGDDDGEIGGVDA